MFNSVRVRMTLWYMLFFGSLLVGFSILVYSALSHSIYSRLDQSLINSSETAANLFRTEMAENQGDPAAAASDTLNEMKLGDVRVAIFQGTTLLTANYPTGQPVSVPEASSRPSEETGEPALATVEGFGEEGARLAMLRLSNDEAAYSIVLAQPLHETVEQLEALARVFYIAVPAALLLAGAGGLLLARKSLAPVAAMSEQAARISALNLSERLGISNPHDELGGLATVLNDLLSRLDRSFENLRRFTADASHELRTPLSIVRGEAEVALSQERDGAEYRESLAIIEDEAMRLSRIVDDMLALTRADAGQQQLNVEEFYLNDLVEECARSAQVLGLGKAVSLTLEPAPDTVFCGDEVLLRRMIDNLLDNAMKYTPSGGQVSIKLISNEANVQIIVSDTGIGIPAECAAQVFERFYRVDPARSRSDSGSGLGLSIAKWAAEAHHGSITLDSRPGRGSTFTVSLPQKR
jgi:heavy metal sensor kinase